MPMHSSELPTFSSVRFSVAGFMLRSLIHLDLSFVHGELAYSFWGLVHFHHDRDQRQVGTGEVAESYILIFKRERLDPGMGF